MTHGNNIAGDEIQAHRDDASCIQIFYPSPCPLQGHFRSWQGRKNTGHFRKMEKTLQLPSWLAVSTGNADD